MIRQFIFTAASIFSCATLYAQGLTLDELISTAYQQNPNLEIEQENVNQQLLSKETADKRRWPSLSLSGSTTNTAWDQTGSAAISLSQAIYQGGSIGIQQTIAQLNLQKSQIAMERKKQSLRKDVELAYIDLLQAIALREEDEKSLTQLQEQARISKILYSEGDVWKNDALQADVSIAQGETQLIAANNRILRAQSALNILLNFELDKNIQLNGALLWHEHQWTWEKIQDAIQTQHPDILTAKINEEISSLGIRSQKSKKMPNVNFSSSVSRSENFSSDVDGSNNLSLSLSANWTFWDAGNTNRNISTARLDKKKKSIELYNKRQQVLKQAQLSWLSLQEAAAQVKVLKQAIGIAKENYRVNTVRYQEKLGTANDLLTAQTLLSKSKKDWLSALASYSKALYTLKFNIGQ